jgi:chromosome partitioning protein
MAKIIVFGNEKGGSGKSTTAIHVAIGLCYQQKSVGVIDLDIRQRSMFRFLENRVQFSKKSNTTLPSPKYYKINQSKKDSKAEANLEEEKSFAEALMSLEKTCDFLVIDCPGGISNYVKMAHTVADILVTPMNDSLIDFDLLAKVEASTGKVIGPSIYSEMVWECRQLRASAKHPPIDWIILRNRISHVFSKNKYQVGKSLKNLSKRIGFRLGIGFSERVIFKELFLSGLTLLDLEKMKDWQPTLSHVSARQEMRMLLDNLNLDTD